MIKIMEIVINTKIDISCITRNLIIESLKITRSNLFKRYYEAQDAFYNKRKIDFDEYSKIEKETDFGEKYIDSIILWIKESAEYNKLRHILNGMVGCNE